jgi:hypothetical protein
MVMLPTEQAAAKVAALIGKVAVKTATLERAAVLMGEASGLDTEYGLRHFQACLSSSGVMYVSGIFLRAYPETMVLMDGPWGRFEELTHVLWLFSLAKYVLVSILAIQVVWRRFHLEIIVLWGVVTDDDSICDGKAVESYGGETVGVG